MSGRKPIEECTTGEVKALLTAGTIIVFSMLAVSLFSRQPLCFLWPLRVFVLFWVAAVWWKGLKRLRELQSKN